MSSSSNSFLVPYYFYLNIIDIYTHPYILIYIWTNRQIYDKCITKRLLNVVMDFYIWLYMSIYLYVLFWPPKSSFHAQRIVSTHISITQCRFLCGTVSQFQLPHPIFVKGSTTDEQVCSHLFVLFSSVRSELIPNTRLQNSNCSTFLA